MTRTAIDRQRIAAVKVLLEFGWTFDGTEWISPSSDDATSEDTARLARARSPERS